MPSSVIRHFDYLAERRELVVTFVSGRRYVYSGVPAQSAEAFRAARSKGSYFNRNIRDVFPAREIAPD